MTHRFIQITTKGELHPTAVGLTKGRDRWVAQPFDSWLGFLIALWRLWKTRRHWL
jgi:hypothetical protein